MAILTREQIVKLADIIRRSASWLTWRLLEGGFVTDADLNVLKQQGLLPMDVSVESIRYAFVLGELESVLREAEWKNLSWDMIVEAAAKQQTPLQEMQIQAAQFATQSVFRGLEQEISSGLFEELAKATKKAVTEASIETQVATTVSTGIKLRQNYREVASALRERLQGTKRNWHRVAITELHSAREQGVVAAILSGIDVYRFADGKDSQVAVVPDGNACGSCKQLYLDPATGNPKIFKLGELLGNTGSNYVRPWRKNAKPVVPPLHPNCECHLRYVPDGWGWDSKGKFTVVDEGTDKSIDEGEVMAKSQAQSHEVLNSAAGLIPTDDDIAKLETREQIIEALDRINSLKDMYGHDGDMWWKLNWLGIKIQAQDKKISSSQEKPAAPDQGLDNGTGNQ